MGVVGSPPDIDSMQNSRSLMRDQRDRMNE